MRKIQLEICSLSLMQLHMIEKKKGLSESFQLSFLPLFSFLCLFCLFVLLLLLLVGGVSSVGFRVESSILSGQDLFEICPDLKPSSEAQPIEDDIQGQVYGEGFFQFALSK